MLNSLARFVSFTNHPKFPVLRFSTIATTQCGGEQSPETKHRRVELPKELSKNVIKLSCESTSKDGVCDVYVVGTRHISKVPTAKEMFAVWKKERNFFELLYHRFLAECGRELGVYPGGEFRFVRDIEKQRSMVAKWHLVIAQLALQSRSLHMSALSWP